MRIVIVGLNFAPEKIGVGKYTGQMSAALSGKGHHVSVVTTQPYYPEPEANPSSKFMWQSETWMGCHVVRCPLYVPQSWRGWQRAIHLLSFAITSAPALAFQLLRAKANIIAAIAPTIISAPWALLLAKITGATSWLHIQDFEVEAATKLGLIKQGRLISIARFFERWLLNRFDLISTISQPMISALHNKGLDPNRVFLLPNWTDTSEIFPLPRPSALRQELGIPEERCVVLYSGNLGAKQGWDDVIAAARILAESPGSSPLLVIAGAGSGRGQIERDAKGLNNVMLLPLQPEARFNEFLNAGDIHLLPQLTAVNDLVMPSKLGAILASGKPVIATVSPQSQIATAVGEAGVIIPAHDPSSLAKAISELAADPARRAKMGANARATALGLPLPSTIFADLEARLQITIRQKRE